MKHIVTQYFPSSPTAPALRRRSVAALLFLCTLLSPFLLQAQTEVRMKDGTLVQGRIADNSEQEMVIRVTSASTGGSSDITLEKANMAYVRDLIHDRDVSLKYIGHRGEGFASRPGATPQQGDDRPLPPTRETLAPGRVPPSFKGDDRSIDAPGSVQFREERAPTDTSSAAAYGVAEQSSRAAAGSNAPVFPAETRYQTVFSAGYLHTSYVFYIPSLDRSSFSTDRNAGFISFSYSFVPLGRDEAHASTASIDVLPKTEIAATISGGPEAVEPLFSMKPSQYRILLSGSVLASPTLGIGGKFLYWNMWEDNEYLSGTETDMFTVVGAAPMLAIYVSPTIRLTEAFGFGAFGRSSGGFYSSHSRTYTWSQFSHSLSVVLSPTVAYTHSLDYTCYAGSGSSLNQVDFRNRLEIPMAPTLEIGIDADYHVTSISNQDETYKLLSLGADLAWYALPKCVFRINAMLHNYLGNIQADYFTAAYTWKDYSFLSLRASGELRF